MRSLWRRCRIALGTRFSNRAASLSGMVLSSFTSSGLHGALAALGGPEVAGSDFSSRLFISFTIRGAIGVGDADPPPGPHALGLKSKPAISKGRFELLSTGRRIRTLPPTRLTHYITLLGRQPGESSGYAIPYRAVVDGPHSVHRRNTLG